MDLAIGCRRQKGHGSRAGYKRRMYGASMIRLDYLSCLLTVASTVLVGRRMWQGWVVAAVNSVVVCMIGLRTAQLGFVPANLFCIAIYAHNISSWRNSGKEVVGGPWRRFFCAIPGKIGKPPDCG
jgi:hypothetical protein